jgi:hypothetical protein
MIVIVDPALFITDSANGPLSPVDESVIGATIEDLHRICRDRQGSIPNALWYWNELRRDLIGPLLQRTKPGSRIRMGLDRLHGQTRSVALVDEPVQGTMRFWGVKPLFAWERLPSKWLGIMERILSGCIQNDEESILITRLFPARNTNEVAVGKCTLIEKTRWELKVCLPGHSPRRIRCVGSLRNVNVPWTTRFDDNLPDVGRFPFCPPANWWRRDMQVCRTFESKPAWLDRLGSGWAQPATGGSYHWDVFLGDSDLEQRVGLNPLNIVAWGTTEAGKIPGDIHHIPAKKKGRLREGAGWTCPKGP